MMRRMAFLVGLVVLALAGSALAERIIYVDGNAPGANNGTRWEDAHRFLQDALADANAGEKPVEIRVAQGIYRPDRNSAHPNGIGDRKVSFLLINGVTLKGGFAGVGESDPNARNIKLCQSTLSGDLAGNDILSVDTSELLTHYSRSENCYNVVTGDYTDDTAILDGFIVTSGNANGSFSGHQRGGGIRSWQGKPLVVNCTIRVNAAKQIGGGLAECGVVENCVVEFNWAGQGGGIFSCGPIRNCVIRANEAETHGGGLHSCSSISSCIITKNIAGWSGGGLEFSGAIEDSAIIANVAGDDGGGVHDCRSSITGSLIIANQTHGSGGGLSGCDTLANCTIIGNKANNRGAAVFCPTNPTTVTNCILWNNISPHGDQVGLSEGCVGAVVRGGNQQADCYYGSVEFSYSNVEGGPASVYREHEKCQLKWLEGNTDVDPCFPEPGYWDANGTPQDANDDFWIEGDYHLRSQAGRWDASGQKWVQDVVTSPCIDAGDPTSPIGLEPFPNGGRINMGAFGGTTEASMSWFGGPVCETVVAGDINGDCKVDFVDFAIMALHWLQGTGGE